MAESGVAGRGPGRRRTPGRVGALLAWIVALVALVVAVTSLVRLADALTPAPLQGEEAERAIVVPVQTRERTSSVEVSLKANTEEGQAVRAPRAGVLTAVPARGAEITDGAAIAQIDDRPVVAMSTRAPLYRDLGSGDTGPDVTRLQEWLAGLDLLDSPPDGRFGPATARAVREFNRRLARSGGSSTFSLGTVAWIGPGTITVASAAALGTRTDPGAELLRGPAVVRSVSVTEPAGTRVTPDARYEVVVGEIRAPYQPGSGRLLDPAAVRAVAAAIGSSGEGTGVVRSVTSTPVRVVPAGALLTDRQGRTCVFPDATGAPVVVSPVGGGVGTADLPGSLSLTTVLANPAQVRGESPCA